VSGKMIVTMLRCTSCEAKCRNAGETRARDLLGQCWPSQRRHLKSTPSEDVTQRESCHMVRRLNAVLNVDSERLSERRRTKRQMAISVQKNSGISTLAGSLIDANPPDNSRRQSRLTSAAKSRIGDSRGMECTDAGQERQPPADIMRCHGSDHPSSLVTDERVAADGRQSCSAIGLEKDALRSALELEAGGVCKRNR